MARVADTSALYAVIDVLDEFHASATQALADPETVLVPREILAETVDLIRYRLGSKVASKALTALLALPHVRIAEPARMEAVERLFLTSGKLSLRDCIVVETCREAAAQALAYDEGILALVE